MLFIQDYILLPYYQTNTWLIYDSDSRDAILIDPSAPDEALLKHIRSLELKVHYIVNTHGHGDHIGGNDWFREKLKAQLAIHCLDAPMLTDNKKNLSAYMDSPLSNSAADILLEDDQMLEAGTIKLRVIHTPGHTPGGICLLAEDYLISGDTLFEQSIGRTDFPGGSHSQIISSIKTKLFNLPEKTLVCPGHGPKTTIGTEKINNPFIH